MKLTEFLNQYPEIINRMENLSPQALNMMIDEVAAAWQESPFFRPDGRFNSLDTIASQFERAEKTKVLLLYYLREYSWLMNRLPYDLGLELQPRQWILQLSAAIRDVDAVLDQLASTAKLSQLTLFDTYINKRGDWDKMNKRLVADLRQALQTLLATWQHPDLEFPPLKDMFADILKRNMVTVISKQLDATVSKEYPQLHRMWGFGTVRTPDKSLYFRFQQLFGNFELQKLNDVSYYQSPDRGILLMRVEDVYSLPFYIGREKICDNLSRFAPRPPLLHSIPNLDWDHVIIDDMGETVTLINKQFYLDLADYHYSMLAVSGLNIERIEYIASQVLVLVFIADAELAICIGRKERMK